MSIYFHLLEDEEERVLYRDTPQLNGTAAHSYSDDGTYSTEKTMLQGMRVYCERYDLLGKIDTFDSKRGILTERKKRIKTVYDGYVFQLYAQYFALTDMGYDVRELRLYSMDDNKVYRINSPTEDKSMLEKFEQLLRDIRSFSFDGFRQLNTSKGLASKLYFKNHFSNMEWKGRQPRLKNDYVNAVLGIGYTLLFAFMDALLSSFGFDTYCGVMHREFYMRKSLVCDLVECGLTNPLNFYCCR